MSTAVSRDPDAKTARAAGAVASRKAEALADRLERGAAALAELAAGLTEAQWLSRVKDGRRIGTVVHHVASVYPVEIKLALTIAGNESVVGVTTDDINAMNGAHAKDNDAPAQQATIELLLRNSAAAAAAIRRLSDEELDRATPVSLYADAPLTCQFVLEDHAVRHSYHHLAKIRSVLKG